jgi:hypothetical protein
LHFLIRKQPDQRLILQVYHLNPIAKRIAEIAAKAGNQFQSVFLYDLLPHFSELRFIAHENSKTPHPVRLHFLDLEDREELMFAQFEKRIAFALVEFLEG